MCVGTQANKPCGPARSRRILVKVCHMSGLWREDLELETNPAGRRGHHQGSIMPRMVKKIMAASRPDTGTVITQAAAILSSAERFTSSLR